MGYDHGMPATETATVHVDDLGDVTVHLLHDSDLPCPTCATPGHAIGWRILTVATVNGRRFDVFRCPTCATACGLAE